MYAPRDQALQWSFVVDLYSANATRLRVDMELARAEMQAAKSKLESARAITRDAGLINPDGIFACQMAIRDSNLASEKYAQGLMAWADHILGS